MRSAGCWRIRWAKSSGSRSSWRTGRAAAARSVPRRGAAGRIKAAQVKALVNTGGTRSPLIAEVPTMAEAGVSDFVLGALFGVFVPAGTPKEALERLAREVAAATQSADFRKRVIDIGQEVTEPLAGEAFGRVMRAEAARWRELATMAGVKDE